MYSCGLEESVIDIRDSVRGVITGQNRDGGLYVDIQIEDEKSKDGIITIPAFGYWTGHVARGTEIFCTIKSWARDNKRIVVRIDSVDYDSDIAV